MRRLLAIAAVALLTACGAGHKPVALTHALARPHVVERKHASVKEIAAARQRVAYRKAKALLRRFVPPPGASRTRPPRPYDGFDISSVGGPVASDGVTVIRSQVWRTPMSYPEAVAYVERHVPAGFSGRWEGASTDDPTYNPQWSDYSYSKGDSRVIGVAVAGFPTGRVVIEVDASVTWIYPRSPQQVAPAATREVDIRAHKSSMKVTDPDKVRRIVRRFNALLLLGRPRNAVFVGCNANVAYHWYAPNIDVVFRSASGVRLASASAPVRRADHCDPIYLSVGKKVTLVVDRLSGPSFVSRAGKLLDVRLTPPG